MLHLVFFALLITCLVAWSIGAPIWLVFGLALAAWIVFYVIVYPKIRTYKVAMGIDAAEETGWAWVKAKLAGFKVLLLGFTMSMVPFAGDAAQWLAGQDLSFALNSLKPEGKQMVTFIIGLIVFVAPFLTQWLHSGTAAKAATSAPN